MKNVVTICGLETLHPKPDHVIHADTFFDVALTYKHDNPKDHYTILDARSFMENDDPLGSLWLALSDLSKKTQIDVLNYAGHSSDEGLYAFSKYRNELADCYRVINTDTVWEEIQFAEGAEIRLMGCQTGGQEGKKWPVCMAQDIANKTGVIVWAFTSKSSQKQRKDGQYVMVPDVGGYVKFTSNE